MKKYEEKEQFSIIGTNYPKIDGVEKVTGRARYIGDEIVAIAATSERIAQQACNLVKVEYEVLPAYFTPQEAMAGSVAIHEHVGVQFDADGSVREREMNVNQYNVVEKGDVDCRFHTGCVCDIHVVFTPGVFATSVSFSHRVCLRHPCQVFSLRNFA